MGGRFLTFILVVAAVAAGLWWWLGRTPTPRPEFIVSSAPQAATTSEAAPTATVPTKDTCESSWAGIISEQAGTIDPDTLLVTFRSGTSFTDALASVRGYGFEPATLGTASSSFESGTWMTVSRGRRSLAEAACVLQGEVLVERVTVNPLLLIHP